MAGASGKHCVLALVSGHGSIMHSWGRGIESHVSIWRNHYCIDVLLHGLRLGFSSNFSYSHDLFASLRIDKRFNFFDQIEGRAKVILIYSRSNATVPMESAADKMQESNVLILRDLPLGLPRRGYHIPDWQCLYPKVVGDIRLTGRWSRVVSRRQRLSCGRWFNDDCVSVS